MNKLLTFVIIWALEIMRYALIVFDKPDREDPDGQQARFDFSKALLGIFSKDEEIEILSDNVLLICLQKSLPAFGNVLHAAHKTGLSYRVLFLDDPGWLWSKGI